MLILKNLVMSFTLLRLLLKLNCQTELIIYFIDRRQMEQRLT